MPTDNTDYIEDSMYLPYHPPQATSQPQVPQRRLIQHHTPDYAIAGVETFMRSASHTIYLSRVRKTGYPAGTRGTNTTLFSRDIKVPVSPLQIANPLLYPERATRIPSVVPDSTANVVELASSSLSADKALSLGRI